MATFVFIDRLGPKNQVGRRLWSKLTGFDIGKKGMRKMFEFLSGLIKYLFVTAIYYPADLS